MRFYRCCQRCNLGFPDEEQFSRCPNTDCNRVTGRWTLTGDADRERIERGAKLAAHVNFERFSQGKETPLQRRLRHQRLRKAGRDPEALPEEDCFDNREEFRSIIDDLALSEDERIRIDKLEALLPRAHAIDYDDSAI